MIEILNQSAQGFAATGNVGALLLQNNLDVNILRPFVDPKTGGHFYTRATVGADGQIQNQAVPLTNAVATLRRDEWIQIDEAVVRAARNRLRLVSDIRGAGLEYRVNGMSKTVLETSTMTKAGKATLSMDPARIGEGDRPEFDSAFLPLPICHSDFYFNIREIAVSRNGAQPLDTTMIEEASVTVAEEIEKLTLGTLDTYSYSGGTIYGLLNYPSRETVDITAPTASAWTGTLFIEELLEMRQAAADNKRYGPYVLYISPGWARYLDGDYSASKGENTIRQRALAVEGITDIRQLDFLTGYQMILVQMTSNNIRMVVGLDLTTIQWETIGGMRQNFKVMALMVPQLRVDGDGNTGIVHGS